MAILQIWPLRGPGIRFTIYAWGNSEDCELVEFLSNLEQTAAAEHEKIFSLIKYASEHGPPKNPQKCRPLEGYHAEKLFELKTTGGVRIIWFYDENQVIICTHGFGKVSKKELKIHIKKAQSIRQQYLKEQEEDNG